MMNFFTTKVGIIYKLHKSANYVLQQEICHNAKFNLLYTHARLQFVYKVRDFNPSNILIR